MLMQKCTHLVILQELSSEKIMGAINSSSSLASVSSLCSLLYRYAQMSPAILLSLNDQGEDGIVDLIDGEYVGGSFVDQATVFSDTFTDQHREGTSFGVIAERDNLGIRVIEILTPKGFVVGAENGSGSATLTVCELTILLSEDDVILVTCGSMTVRVQYGPIDILLIDSIVVTASSGATVTVDRISDDQFRIDNSESSSSSISYRKRGHITHIRACESVVISSDQVILAGEEPRKSAMLFYGTVAILILIIAVLAYLLLKRE